MIPRATRAIFSVYDGATMYRMDWTDERLQERFDSIDRRFDEVNRRFDDVDRRIDDVDRRIDDLDRRLDKRFDKVEAELKDGLNGLGAKIDSKFDGLQRTLMITGGGIIATLIAAMATVIATQL